MSDEIAQILAAVTRLEERAATRDDLTKLQGEMADFRSGVVEELAKTRTDLMARMNRHAEQLTTIREDISVDMGASDAAQRVNDNTRDDMRSLRDQVSVMWRQIKSLEEKVRQMNGDT